MSFTQEKYKRLEAVLKAESEKKEDRSLPDPPKTAQDIWQQSVIGDYLARFKVGNLQTGGSLFRFSFYEIENLIILICK